MKYAILVICAIGMASVVLAGDPPRKAASRRPARDRDEPPPCAHMQKSAARRPTSGRRPAPRSMPEMFDRMMGDMERNPATGFLGVMKDQEAAAVSSTPLTAAEER